MSSPLEEYAKSIDTMNIRKVESSYIDKSILNLKDRIIIRPRETNLDRVDCSIGDNYISPNKEQAKVIIVELKRIFNI